MESKNTGTTESHIVFVVDLPAGDPLDDGDVMATFTCEIDGARWRHHDRRW